MRGRGWSEVIRKDHHRTLQTAREVQRCNRVLERARGCRQRRKKTRRPKRDREKVNEKEGKEGKRERQKEGRKTVRFVVLPIWQLSTKRSGQQNPWPLTCGEAGKEVLSCWVDGLVSHPFLALISAGAQGRRKISHHSTEYKTQIPMSFKILDQYITHSTDALNHRVLQKVQFYVLTNTSVLLYVIFSQLNRERFTLLDESQITVNKIDLVYLEQ